MSPTPRTPMHPMEPHLCPMRPCLLEPLEQRLLLDGVAEDQALQLFSASPALFVQNQGQWADESVRYVHNGSWANVAMTDAGPVFQVFRSARSDGTGGVFSNGRPEDISRLGADRGPSEKGVLQFSASFIGANAVPPVGLAPSESTFNYSVGDQSMWREGVASYEQVAYDGLYDGIGLVTQVQRDSLKYEFHVAPGADYTQIAVRYEGIAGVSPAEDGSLMVNLGGDWGSLTDDAPYIYQMIDGQKVGVGGRFVLADNLTYSFEITGNYDSTHELIIDPDLGWSSYLGGSGDDKAWGVAVDASGNVLLAGRTYSSGWVSGGFDTTYGGSEDAFVSKFSSSGVHLWSSFLGGSGDDYASSIAVDASGNALVAGGTSSSGWVSGGWDISYNGGYDAFVVKLSSSGGHLWSSYLGGSGYEEAAGIAIDASGNVLVAGRTSSSGWVWGGGDTTYNGGYDAFVLKLSAFGERVWSTYVGGGNDDYGDGLAVDAYGNALLSGYTDSSSWVSGGWDVTFNGDHDAFVTKISSSGATIWSSYLGGSGFEEGIGIASDASGNVLVTGYTNSSGWVSGGWDISYNGGYDAFVVKLSSSGGHVWSSYLGGSSWDDGIGIALDAHGNALVAGRSSSSDWVSGGWDMSYGGSFDGFVVKLSSAGGHVWSSYLGGSGWDESMSVAVDAFGNAFVAGFTSSSGWASSGWDTSYNGGSDAFVAKVTPLVQLEVPYYSQGTYGWCWAASTAMLLGYYGYHVEPWQIAAEDAFNADPNEGFNFTTIEAFLEAKYNFGQSDVWEVHTQYLFADSFKHDIITSIDNGHPVYVSLAVPRHAIVITGYTDDNCVIINDPSAALVGGTLKPNVTMTWDDFFDKAWESWSGLVYANPAKVPVPPSTRNVSVELMANSVSFNTRDEGLNFAWDGREPYDGYRYACSPTAWPADSDGDEHYLDYMAIQSSIMSVHPSYSQNSSLPEEVRFRVRYTITSERGNEQYFQWYPATAMSVSSNSFGPIDGSLALILPVSDLSEGIYRLNVAFIDPVSEEVIDSTECLFGVVAADYRAQSGYAAFSSESIHPGDYFNVLAGIENASAWAGGSYDVKFYASSNATITASDYYLGSYSSDGLAAWACEMSQWLGEFPSIPAGTYYVGWIIGANDNPQWNNTGYVPGQLLTVTTAPPTDISLSSTSIEENQPFGTTVGVFTTTDPDGGAHTYSIVDGDSNVFTIQGNVLRTAAAFDYESRSGYSIRVRSTDPDGLYAERGFTISVVNVNEAPNDISLSCGAIRENQAVDTLIGTCSASDPDGGDHVYTIVDGDSAFFTIQGSDVKAAAVFNYESRSDYGIRIRATDSDGLYTEKIFTIRVLDGPDARIIERHVFYNNSAFDGNDVSANANDDAAIANDKTGLLPGETATFANYTTYSRGINGIMIDVADLSAVPAITDFVFRVGNDNEAASWGSVPAPEAIVVRTGEGALGSDRITITWADGSIQQEWLQLTLLSDAHGGHLGLAEDDVFYFGNAIGDTGNSVADAEVTPTDEIAVRNDPHSLAVNPAGIDDAYDFDRDRKVGPSDSIIARNHGTNTTTALQLITAPRLPAITVGGTTLTWAKLTAPNGMDSYLLTLTCTTDITGFDGTFIAAAINNLQPFGTPIIYQDDAPAALWAASGLNQLNDSEFLFNAGSTNTTILSVCKSESTTSLQASFGIITAATNVTLARLVVPTGTTAIYLDGVIAHGDVADNFNHVRLFATEADGSIVLGTDNLTMLEGEREAVDVSLSSRPTGTVTVNIDRTGGDADMSASSGTDARPQVRLHGRADVLALARHRAHAARAISFQDGTSHHSFKYLGLITHHHRPAVLDLLDSRPLLEDMLAEA